METFSHVVQPSIEQLKKNFDFKGKWNKKFFKKHNPIVLELGCGKGEYSIGLAEKYPHKNFLGIDIKGARMWVGAKIAQQKNMKNVGFLRIRIDLIEKCFAKDEIDEIWITFPDPQIKTRRARKRLTHPIFLKRYSNFLKKGGFIHLKTDSQFLYGYTLRIIETENHILQDATHDLYNEKYQRKHMEIKTYYEDIFLSEGKVITYLRFVLNLSK
tara:strand:- start:309 stop:950 length:642 start_codon:yes stop_codon:yes gene_type:complete